MSGEDGSAIRDLAYSEDVAKGVILALHHGTEGRYTKLGSGRGYSIRELAETLRSFIPFDYEFGASKPAGFPKRVMDITLARKISGYIPTTSLLAGLKRTWAWYVGNEDEYLLKQDHLRE